MDIDSWITAVAAARLLGVTRGRVYQFVREEELPPPRHIDGRTRLFDKVAVLNLVERRQRQAAIRLQGYSGTHPSCVAGVRSGALAAGTESSNIGTVRGPAATEQGNMVGALADQVDKVYAHEPLAELADAPVTALQCVSDSAAAHLKAAFNIATVRDLGTNMCFLQAQAISRLADSPSALVGPQ